MTGIGPRQSGKTTLCRAVFADKEYVSLEPLDVRESVVADPRGFLQQYPDGAIVDEVQRAPELLSYLQEEVDTRPKPGRFILTGSQHLGLSAQISQSLAGRTGVLRLLPPSLQELRRFENIPSELWELVWTGAYPRVFDQGIPPGRWYADYVATYVQKDVQDLLNIQNLQAFTQFLKLCAGRTGQLVNLSSLGADVGVSHNTIRTWLTVLEASFLCFQLPAWHTNARKQVVKSPKLHFLDTGLVCYLLGLREPEQLRHHPLRGAIFESWVASELYKQSVHQGHEPSLHHYRDAKGTEVDIVEALGDRLRLFEIKSGATFSTSFLGPLERLAKAVQDDPQGRQPDRYLVYGGERSGNVRGCHLVPWHEVVNLSGQPTPTPPLQSA